MLTTPCLSPLSPRGAAAWALILFLAAVPALRADDLSFGAGERLSGALVRLADGKLTIRSAAAGEVTLPWASVTDVRTARGVAVQLAGGRTFTGVLEGIEGGMLRVAASTGTERVKVGDVLHMAPETAPAAPRAQWSGTADMGLGVLAGNSNRQDYQLGTEVRRHAPTDRWHLTANVQHGQSLGRTDVSRARGGLTYSHNLAGRHYYSTGAFIVHDDITGLRLSGYYFLSRGYRLVDSHGSTANLEMGGTYVNDNYRADRREGATGLVRAIASMHVLRRSTLDLTAMVWPSVGLSRLRGNSVLSLNVPMGGNMGVRLGVTDDYDSNPPPNVRRYDLQTNLSLTYKL